MTKSVLVVDDSVSMRQMVSFTMKEAGFEVTEAGNGAEALSRIQGKSISLVITDLNMPVMDGLTFIRQIRSKPEYKFTPILMLTTESQQEKKMEGKAAGATGWIVKPFNPDQLLQTVSKVVR
jgi:two-component system, chemotaxis family, chemotaxis protein CheY